MLRALFQDHHTSDSKEGFSPYWHDGIYLARDLNHSYESIKFGFDCPRFREKKGLYSEVKVYIHIHDRGTGTDNQDGSKTLF